MSKDPESHWFDGYVPAERETESRHSGKPAYVGMCRGRIRDKLRGYPHHAQDELDLHRCKYQEAMNKLATFIRESINARLRTIRIITGRGKHSKDGRATLRDATGYRLKQLQENRIVRAYRLEDFSKHGSYMVYL